MTQPALPCISRHTIRLAILSTLTIAVGCGGASNRNGSTPREIGLEAFTSPVSTSASESSEHEGGENVVAATEGSPQSDEAPLPDAIAEPAPATTGASATTRVQPGERIIIDSLVGQVNGRPVFADEFFTPIADQLWAAARGATVRGFEQQAREIIAQRLRSIVTNELVIADAQAQLSVEQQQGLFHALRLLREEEIAKLGGTRAGATQRLQEEEGISLDDYISSELDAKLVQGLYVEKILPRATYSWRDVELEYRRRHEEFNPPGQIHISRLRVPTAEIDRVAEVQRRLESGEPFAEIAASLGEPDGGAWQSFVLPPDGLAGLPLSENVRQQLIGLERGETSEPFELGSSTWWLHIAEITQLPGRDLYEPEVQRALSERIRQQRFREEEDRYVQSLLQRGIYDELNAMNEVLVRIALLRYGPK